MLRSRRAVVERAFSRLALWYHTSGRLGGVDSILSRHTGASAMSIDPPLSHGATGLSISDYAAFDDAVWEVAEATRLLFGLPSTSSAASLVSSQASKPGDEFLATWSGVVRPLLSDLLTPDAATLQNTCCTDMARMFAMSLPAAVVATIGRIVTGPAYDLGAIITIVLNLSLEIPEVRAIPQHGIDTPDRPGTDRWTPTLDALSNYCAEINRGNSNGGELAGRAGVVAHLVLDYVTVFYFGVVVEELYAVQCELQLQAGSASGIVTAGYALIRGPERSAAVESCEPPVAPVPTASSPGTLRAQPIGLREPSAPGGKPAHSPQQKDVVHSSSSGGGGGGGGTPRVHGGGRDTRSTVGRQESSDQRSPRVATSCSPQIQRSQSTKSGASVRSPSSPPTASERSVSRVAATGLSAEKLTGSAACGGDQPVLSPRSEGARSPLTRRSDACSVTASPPQRLFVEPASMHPVGESAQVATSRTTSEPLPAPAVREPTPQRCQPSQSPQQSNSVTHHQPVVAASHRDPASCVATTGAESTGSPTERCFNSQDSSQGPVGPVSGAQSSCRPDVDSGAVEGVRGEESPADLVRQDGAIATMPAVSPNPRVQLFNDARPPTQTDVLSARMLQQQLQLRDASVPLASTVVPQPTRCRSPARYHHELCQEARHHPTAGITSSHAMTACLRFASACRRLRGTDAIEWQLLRQRARCPVVLEQWMPTLVSLITAILGPLQRLSKATCQNFPAQRQWSEVRSRLAPRLIESLCTRVSADTRTSGVFVVEERTTTPNCASEDEGAAAQRLAVYLNCYCAARRAIAKGARADNKENVADRA